MKVDSLLQPFQRFGVCLGLERIQDLLAKLDNPHDRVPFVHVAGTNGKGSVCAYLASILQAAGYRVGRYTSTHLVRWNERICIDNEAIATSELLTTLEEVIAVAATCSEPPTQFEIFTAATWLYFARQKVEIAAIEVGLGGRLDATNVSDRPLACAIASISREHWQQLGSTLTQIAGEKAGILKPNRPVAIAPLPEEAATVFANRVKELNCHPVVWVQPAISPAPGRAIYQGIEYQLPLLGEIQLTNSATAIATIGLLQQQGWSIPTEAIVSGIARTQWLGRLQWAQWKGKSLLLDGAHNPAAAIALRQYVDTLEPPITWVMGMLATKEHETILKTLLREGDRLYLVPVPDHKTASVEDLANLAKEICPQLVECRPCENLPEALDLALTGERSVVLCGSLYLVGHFLALIQES